MAVIGGFCSLGRCAPASDGSNMESPVDTTTPLRRSMSPSQSPVKYLAPPGEACTMDEDCSNGMCARSAETPNDDATKQRCVSRNTVFIDQVGATVCLGTANTGSTCYNGVNALCKSGVCVDDVCQSSKLGANQGCDDPGDCITNSCALETALWPSVRVCCASGEAIALANATACTEQPVGALCGNSNAICQSGLCLNARCAEIDKDAGRYCTSNKECKATCVKNVCTSSNLVPGDVCDDYDDCPFDCAFESRTQLTDRICCGGGSEFFVALRDSIFADQGSCLSEANVVRPKTS